MFGVDPISRSSEMGVVRFIGVTPGMYYQNRKTANSKTSVTVDCWLCFSNLEGERKWLHSFLLLTWNKLFGNSKPICNLGICSWKKSWSGSPPSTMIESKMLPLKLSAMDFPRIRVRLLLFTEYVIIKSSTGMWPHAFTFFIWQTKPRDQNRTLLPPKSTALLVFEFTVYLFR